MESENFSGNSSVSKCDVILLSKSGTTIVVALLYAILIPPIVVGNGLVVISFIINHKLRTATNIFICGLGLSDLLIGLFSVPYWIYISSLEVLMSAFCSSLYRVYICLDIWTGCASILQLTAIAIERLYFTVAPLRHRRLTRSIYWYMIGIAWFYSTFMAVLQPLQANWAKEYSLLLMITCFMFPLFIIVTVYLYILKVGRRQAQKKSSTRKRMGSTGGDFKEFNIFITVIVITGVFIIAWAPFFVVTVIASLCHSCITHPEHDPLIQVVKWMQYSSSAINPYIYAYRNEEVRRTFKKILRLVCLCGCFGSRTGLDKERHSRRNTRLNSIAQTNVDKLGNRVESIQTPSRQHRQHYPRILDIDEFIGHTSRSGTDAPRDSRDREWRFTKENFNPRSSAARVQNPANKNVGFYENNGYARIKRSTRGNQKTNGDINRNVRQKGLDNEAFHLQELAVRKEFTTEDKTDKNCDSGNEGYKRQPNVSRKSQHSSNQNKSSKPRDSSIAHLSQSDANLHLPGNQKRFLRSHGIKLSRNVNETSHKSTNQLRRHRPRDKEQPNTRTCEEISDNASYV